MKDKINHRINAVDEIKGLCMLFVFIGHCFLSSYFNLKDIIFSFHMPLFFILSGYFFKEKNYKALLKSGWNRLLVPYLLSSFVVIAIIIVTGDFQGALMKILAIFFPRGFYSEFTSFQLSHVIGATWFLIALFWARVVFNSIVKISNRYKERKLIIFTISLIVSISSIYVSKFTLFPFGILEGTQALVFMAIGVLPPPPNNIYKLFDSQRLGFRFIIVLVIWLISIHFSRIDMAPIIYENYLLALLGAVSGSYIFCEVTILSSMIMPFWGEFLRIIGRHSLAALCVHSVCFVPSAILGFNHYIAFAFNSISILVYVYILEFYEKRKFLGRSLPLE